MPKPKCKRCGEQPAVGKLQKKSLPGDLSDKCIECIEEQVNDGTCPMCNHPFASSTHNERCVKVPATV